MRLIYTIKYPKAFELLVYSSDDYKQRNSLIIITDDSTLIVDPSNNATFIKVAVNAIGKRDCLLLYSHSHINHLLGARHLSYKKIFSSALLSANKDFLNMNNIPYPTDTYDGSWSFFLDETQLTLFNMPGHTRDLTVVFIPDYNILFASDLLLSGSIPFLGDGIIKEYIESLELLKNFNAKIIIPGHGKIVPKSDVLGDTAMYIKNLVRFSAECNTFEKLAALPISSFYEKAHDYRMKEFHIINLKKSWNAWKIND